eukprot:g20780.t1
MLADIAVSTVEAVERFSVDVGGSTKKTMTTAAVMGAPATRAPPVKEKKKPSDKGPEITIRESRRAMNSIIGLMCCKHEMSNIIGNVLFCESSRHKFACNALTTVPTCYLKTNHYPGMKILARKGPFSQRIDMYRKIWPRKYKFYPRSWDLSQQEQLHELRQAWEDGRTYIIKPSKGKQGTGIVLVQSFEAVLSYLHQTTSRAALVQEYIDRPLLYRGFKFDFRIYVLITSLRPPTVHVFREGLTRFCSLAYSAPTEENLSQSYMHLTNYSLNKDSPTFLEAQPYIKAQDKLRQLVGAGGTSHQAKAAAGATGETAEDCPQAASVKTGFDHESSSHKRRVSTVLRQICRELRLPMSRKLLEGPRLERYASKEEDAGLLAREGEEGFDTYFWRQVDAIVTHAMLALLRSLLQKYDDQFARANKLFHRPDCPNHPFNHIKPPPHPRYSHKDPTTVWYSAAAYQQHCAAYTQQHRAAAGSSQQQQRATGGGKHEDLPATELPPATDGETEVARPGRACFAPSGLSGQSAVFLPEQVEEEEEAGKDKCAGGEENAAGEVVAGGKPALNLESLVALAGSNGKKRPSRMRIKKSKRPGRRGRGPIKRKGGSGHAGPIVDMCVTDTAGHWDCSGQTQQVPQDSHAAHMGEKEDCSQAAGAPPPVASFAHSAGPSAAPSGNGEFQARQKVLCNCAQTERCFHFVGFDVLLDESLKAWLLELNNAPSFHCRRSELDNVVKQGVFETGLWLLGLLTGEQVVKGNKAPLGTPTGAWLSHASRAEQAHRVHSIHSRPPPAHSSSSPLPRHVVDRADRLRTQASAATASAADVKLQSGAEGKEQSAQQQGEEEKEEEEEEEDTATGTQGTTGVASQAASTQHTTKKQAACTQDATAGVASQAACTQHTTTPHEVEEEEWDTTVPWERRYRTLRLDVLAGDVYLHVLAEHSSNRSHRR